MELLHGRRGRCEPSRRPGVPGRHNSTQDTRPVRFRTGRVLFSMARTMLPFAQLADSAACDYPACQFPGSIKDQDLHLKEKSVTIREVQASGLKGLTLATDLLQRSRRADPLAGIWEAADLQWSWRKPRPSDDVDQIFWTDDEGPIAGVLLTSMTDERWQCDPIIVPGTTNLDPDFVWQRALEHAAKHSPDECELPISDDDPATLALARRSGATFSHQDSTAWMAAEDRPAIIAPADGYVVVDRSQRLDAPHHMRHRNGEQVADRLAQCSLYDPSLDLIVESTEGEVAGYSLYWFDPVTKTGLVEPVGIEEAFRRQGLARAMLTEGIDRLARKGAVRIKISYETEPAAALYKSVGFLQTSTTSWYRIIS